MDQEPIRLKHQGGRLLAAVEALEQEWPSEDQVRQLQADLWNAVDLTESESGIRVRFLAEAQADARQTKPVPPATDPTTTPSVVKTFRPSWGTVAFAAAASALLTLTLTQLWHGSGSTLQQRSLEAAGSHRLVRESLGASAAELRVSQTENTSSERSTDAPSLPIEEALGPAETAHAGNEVAVPTSEDHWGLNPKAAGGGWLNLNSIPRARVSVNGRPLGYTPVVGQLVEAGEQIVVFDHPIFGRKRRVLEVSPGESVLTAVRFP